MKPALLLSTILMVQIVAGECVTRKMLQNYLFSYSVRAGSLGISQATISCVFRKVHMAAIDNACFDGERFGKVMGDALPKCMKAESPQLPTYARLFNIGRKRRCHCDSRCHYCCSFRNTNIPGSPREACFRKARCQPRHAKCKGH